MIVSYMPSWLVTVVYAIAIGVACREVATEHKCSAYTGTSKGVVYFTISITVAVPAHSTHALHYVIVMTCAATYTRDTTLHHQNNASL